MQAVGDLAAFLAGAWDVEREIADVRSATAGRFCGTASFTRDSDSDGDGDSDSDSDGVMRWTEIGELDWLGHRSRAGRNLQIVVRSRAPADVLFDDGRFFHLFDLSSGVSEFVHDCARDRYTGSLTVVSLDLWRLRWDVDGPAKLLTITSTYRRVERGRR